MNTEFKSKILKLNSNRRLARKFTEISHALSIAVAKSIRDKAKANNVTLKMLSLESGIPAHSITNWLWGSSTHTINEEAAKKMWQALSKKLTMKASEHKDYLDSLDDKQFIKLSSREIAKRAGCSSSAVLRYINKYKKPKYKRL